MALLAVDVGLHPDDLRLEFIDVLTQFLDAERVDNQLLQPPPLAYRAFVLFQHVPSPVRYSISRSGGQINGTGAVVIQWVDRSGPRRVLRLLLPPHPSPSARRSPLPLPRSRGPTLPGRTGHHRWPVSANASCRGSDTAVSVRHSGCGAGTRGGGGSDPGRLPRVRPRASAAVTPAGLPAVRQRRDACSGPARRR